MDPAILTALEKEHEGEMSRLKDFKLGTLEHGRQMDLVTQIANQIERYRSSGDVRNELR